MRLPLLISVPHAGRAVPHAVRAYCVLTPQQVIEDGDEGAAEIYDLREHVTAYLTTKVARAIVDLNRPETDRAPDGVVKTHTCRNVPVYSEPLPEEVVERLLGRHYRPYHEKLTQLASRAKLGIDCHTMAPVAPPIGPNPGSERPLICVSNADHTCPAPLLNQLALCLKDAFKTNVSINTPFKGGHIIRTHCNELPWIQLEISRAPLLSKDEKRQRVIDALERFRALVF
jgi:N-formylglutamate deformylase